MIRDDALLCDPAKKRVIELRNQQAVFRYVTTFREVYRERNPIALGVVEELHRLTVEGLYPCGGNARLHSTDHVKIDASFVPATPADVALRLPELIDRARNWNTYLVEGPDDYPPPEITAGPLRKLSRARIRKATELFYEFLVIHPFRGGNGRVSRAFLHMLLYDMEILTPPAHIFDFMERNRRGYFDGLHAADRGNLGPLVQYVHRGIVEAVISPILEGISSMPSIMKYLDRDLRKFLNPAHRDSLATSSYISRLKRLNRKLLELMRRFKQRSPQAEIPA